MGRTGRRTGTFRNCLMLATSMGGGPAGRPELWLCVGPFAEGAMLRRAARSRSKSGLA
jgi:hypothetical protein